MACFGSPISTRGTCPAKRAQDRPLQRVRVLELVDEHHPVAGAHRRPAPRPCVGQGVREPGEQVVVAVQAPLPLASIDLGADGDGEGVPQLRDAARRRVGRSQPGLRVGDSPAGQPQCLRPVEHRAIRTAGGELPHVEVVDDLGDHIVDRLEENAIQRVVGGRAEPSEDLPAELVGGRDRGGVELGQRHRRADGVGP